jgi:23S rRNA pseudouridine1911/1915/1917 synthase
MPTGKPSTKRRKSNRIDILFEDRDMIIVNKPSGLLSVPIPKTQAPNLLEIVNDALDKKGEKAITVHRIDRYTSGAVVFAKNSESHKGLVRQFLSHTPIRTYLALVRGTVTPPSGELIHYMKQVSRGFRNIITKPDDPEGAMARLTYSTEETHKSTSLMKIRLDTGLKNQIRVQFATIGHPMVGDRHYAPEEIKETRIDRQALHSWELELTHPRTGKPIKVRADWPQDFRELVTYYRSI